MAKNSCSVGFNIKFNKANSNLDGHHQTGVIYVWLMLDSIAIITANITESLKEHIKFVGQKGFQGVYHKGENVEWMVMDYTSICNTLD